MSEQRTGAKRKVIVGLSGGVDSSVAALRLLQAGWQVEGLFMKNWEEDDTTTYCAAAADLLDAQQVADKLGIKLHTVNFATEYWDQVFEHFLAEYQAGRTPNPDILCNREIKFKAFLDYALDLGADYIATGHYAGLNHTAADRLELCCALDQNKDQTYFLHLLNQHALRHAQFPLQSVTKPQVRALATQAGFANARKKDSTGICFIGERRFRDFLAAYLPNQPGEIVTISGEVLGTHQGALYYTIGQREGLGIGGQATYGTEPWFVAEKNVAQNRLVVVQGHDHPHLFRQSLIATPVHWIAGSAPANTFQCLARCRHRQPWQTCTVTIDKDDPITAQVVFDQPQRAITPGQAVVFYADQTCLGGGTIQ
ncbi:MAG: tRNA 2-thiouridine(34) synthase MnmA [Pseudomonadota bacterium]